MNKRFQKEIDKIRNKGDIGKQNKLFLKKKFKIKKINLPSPRETYEVNGAGMQYRQSNDYDSDNKIELFSTIQTKGTNESSSRNEKRDKTKLRSKSMYKSNPDFSSNKLDSLLKSGLLKAHKKEYKIKDPDIAYLN